MCMLHSDGVECPVERGVAVCIFRLLRCLVGAMMGLVYTVREGYTRHGINYSLACARERIKNRGLKF